MAAAEALAIITATSNDRKTLMREGVTKIERKPFRNDEAPERGGRF